QRLHAAENDIINGGGVDAGALNERLDGSGAQISGMQSGKRTLLATDRRSYCVNDICLWHGLPFRKGLVGTQRMAENTCRHALAVEARIAPPACERERALEEKVHVDFPGIAHRPMHLH